MAMVEGKGRVKPSPARITLTAGERAELTELARHRESYRRYQQRRDEWGSGLISDAVLLGVFGEFAVCKFYNRRLRLSLDVDREDKPRGDEGYDILPCPGARTQVKTRKRDYGSMLVRRQTKQGGVIPIFWDMCVCCTIQSNLDEPGPIEITLDGWVDHVDIVGNRYKFAKLVPARRGDHLNLEVSDIDFFGVNDLVKKIRRLLPITQE